MRTQLSLPPIAAAFGAVRRRKYAHALVLVLLLPATQAIAAPELSVSAPTTLTGLPVEVEVTLSEGGARPATVFVDGREVGAHNLAAGANALSFDGPGISRTRVSAASEPEVTTTS